MEKPAILICTPDTDLKEILSASLSLQYTCIFHTDAFNLTIKAQGARASKIIIDLGFNYSHIKGEIARVKTYPALRDIPVILLSAHENNEKILKETKADHILLKPFPINSLYEAVSKKSSYPGMKQKDPGIKIQG